MVLIIIQQTSNTIESLTSSTWIEISDIIQRYWSFFIETHWPEGSNRIRNRVLKCFDDLRKCKSQELWFSTFSCPDCNTKKYFFFTCKRRICSSCSKPLCDKRMNGMSERLPTNIPYLHITFTLPEELRDLRLKYRKHNALAIIFKQAQEIIKDIFLKRFGCEPWIFSVIHTFWSYVNRNPHLHFITTLWGIDCDWERISTKGEYISYKSINKQRRARIISERRSLLLQHESNDDFNRQNTIFKKIFKKNWYVTVSDPIFEVSYVMSYIARYMYRPPISITKIVNTTFTDNPHTSTITLKYFHKAPHEERTITYTIFEFLWLIARQLPDKYFRNVRYYWIFTPQRRKKYLAIISNIPAEKGITKPLKKRPKSFQERMISAFGKNPLKCNCWWDMKIESITFRSKKKNSFLTKYFDSS